MNIQPLTIPATLDSLSSIGKYVLRAAGAAGLDTRAAYNLRMAVDEIATNSIVHGYQKAGFHGSIEVSAIFDPDQQTLTIIVEDTAPPFDPRGIEKPKNLEEPLHNRTQGGLGVWIALTYVDHFSYEYVQNRNRNIFVMKGEMYGDA
jgi:anti-sigma regulatory factor (Ser/Thr protein kinase)